MTTETKIGNVKKRKSLFWAETLPQFLDYVVIVLSCGLIAFISYYTFQDKDYLDNNLYMTYQFVVCIIFMIEYLYRFILSEQKIKYLVFAFPFLFISIPYLNIIDMMGLEVDKEILSFLCFIPIIRGLFALVIVVTYITKTMVTTLFVSYILVLVPWVYMSGLIFYVVEKDINHAIKNFWYALWWAGMNVTTIGCYINPMTSMGMFLGFLLSLLGIIMFPIFTVYLGDVIHKYTHKIKDLPQ